MARDVLLRARMKTAVVALALVGSAHVASAGVYLGLGIGPGVTSGGDVDYQTADRNYKALVGYSLGQISIEGSVMRGSLNQNATPAFDVTQLALMGKYSLPISDGFEVFGKAGIQRTTLSSPDALDVSSADTTGSGLIVGAGIEYRLKLVATQASIFVDYTYSDMTLDTTKGDFTTRGFMLGATIGF
jgi:hypothetical protein